MINGIQEHGCGDLPEVSQTTRFATTFDRAARGGKGERCQRRDDSQNHQQFNQAECPGARLPETWASLPQRDSTSTLSIVKAPFPPESSSKIVITKEAVVAPVGAVAVIS